ncbi:KH domain-containing protein, partial [Candidatus Saccharibacteria bacterium]|nr:KH domain-containing protein [Candidatus Saccharibacteria bacterium]
IVIWDDSTKEYIINALSPTKVSSVDIDEGRKKATVKVPEDQLSIAIGKSGQNVRLASKLTGYEIDIVGTKEEQKEIKEEPKQPPKLKKKSELESSLLEAIEEHGEESN